MEKKRPRLKMSTLQRRREDGGLSVPDFKFYFWSFVLRPLLTWFNPSISVSWRSLESSMIEPWSLHDVLFVNISNKQCQLRFGPIISHLMRTWRMVEKHCHISNIWHTLSPIFNNKALLIGGRPISAPPWEQGGVHYLKDIFNNYGLLSFSDIKKCIQSARFFVFLLPTVKISAQGVRCPLARPFTHSPCSETFYITD